MNSMFAREYALPRLPLPALKDTCEGLAELVAPLVEDVVFQNTRRALAEFARPGGAGELLQRRLEEWRDALPGNSSWLRPFWDDMYLEWRGRLPLEMNYFFRFDDGRWGGAAALPRLIRELAIVFERLSRKDVPPSLVRGQPIAMEQALRCFYTRIPGERADTLSPVGTTPLPQAAVVCRGHWFLLSLVGSEGGPVGEDAVAGALASIRAEAARLPQAAPVSAFTAAPRAQAAALRNRLLESAGNRLHFAAIEDALFVVCLDEAASSPDDVGSRLLAGDPACRWFDKSLQIVATEDGALGANFEHAGCDAAIWVSLLELADAAILSAAEAEKDRPGSEAARYRPLVWDVAPETAEELRRAAADFHGKAAGTALCCREYPEFSRNRAKAVKTGPDALYQTSFQAAQHTLFGRLRSSYEAVAMRHYAAGRTECSRGNTPEAGAYARALAGNAAPEALVPLYRAAEAAHNARLVRCRNGQGPERHLAGLQGIYRIFGKELGLADTPALFTDPGVLEMKHDALSTSGIGAPFIRFFGFGPTAWDGFGVGYAPGAERLALVITAQLSSGNRPEAFLAAFEAAAGKTAAALEVQVPGTLSGT